MYNIEVYNMETELNLDVLEAIFGTKFMDTEFLKKQLSILLKKDMI